MAKVSADNLSHPVVKAFAKYHFWMLTAVVPLVLLPLLFMARGELAGMIDAQRGVIDGHVSALEKIQKITQHPNKSWMADMDNSTMRVRKETYAEWRRFWASQKALRTWPASLGPDFVEKAESLKPDGKLSRKLLERYRNSAVSLVRDLPKRMGVEDAIVDPRDAAKQQPGVVPGPGRPADGAPGAGVEESPYVAIWNAENQNRIAASFYWTRVPTTPQVLLAQEELWVYGLLCDVVARLNKSAKGPHDAAIAAVNELAVGYPAAEDNPGGQNGGRIERVAVAAVGGMEGGPPPGPPMGAAGPAGDGATAGRPPHPRFSVAPGGGPPGGMPGGPPGEEPAAVVSPDDQLRNWIYVNFAGKPLAYDELAAAADCQMVHLVPFMLEVMIDERRIDSLLVELATGPIPIDVRQVRINAAAAVSAAGQPPGPGPALPGSAGRLYDVRVELRGTVGLAAPPDVKTVGLEPGQVEDAAPEAGGDKPAAVPEAAGADRSLERRGAA